MTTTMKYLSAWGFFICGLLSVGTCLRPSDLSIYEVRSNRTGDLDINLEGVYNISDTSFNEMDSQSLVRMEKIREGQKQRRIQSIQSEILERLGLQNKPNITYVVSEDQRKQIVRKLEELKVEQDNELLKASENVFAERVQSFYPSCSLPRNTDRDIWDAPDNFHIYYNISSPGHMQGTSINVSSAKLRLFKTEGMESINSSDNTNDGEMPNDQPLFRVPNPNSEQEHMRVTVFQYLRPLRRNRRPKKRLLDSKIISPGYEGWIEFNIQSSIRDWFENGNKNFGLEVVLEDDRHLVVHNPSTILHNMNCSETRATDPPFPRNLFEDDPVVGENESAIFDNETYPTLDLRTVEFHGEQATLPLGNATEKRRKREVGCGSRNDSDECCLETKFINFEDLGLGDFIVAPSGTYFGQCKGNCVEPAEQADNLTYSTQKSCIPDKRASVSVLYVNEDNYVKLGVLKDFLVKSCRCGTANVTTVVD